MSQKYKNSNEEDFKDHAARPLFELLQTRNRLVREYQRLREDLEAVQEEIEECDVQAKRIHDKWMPEFAYLMEHGKIDPRNVTRIGWRWIHKNPNDTCHKTMLTGTLECYMQYRHASSLYHYFLTNCGHRLIIDRIPFGKSRENISSMFVKWLVVRRSGEWWDFCQRSLWQISLLVTSCLFPSPSQMNETRASYFLDILRITWQFPQTPPCSPVPPRRKAPRPGGDAVSSGTSHGTLRFPPLNENKTQIRRELEIPRIILWLTLPSARSICSMAFEPSWRRPFSVGSYEGVSFEAQRRRICPQTSQSCQTWFSSMLTSRRGHSHPHDSFYPEDSWLGSHVFSLFREVSCVSILLWPLLSFQIVCETCNHKRDDFHWEVWTEFAPALRLLSSLPFIVPHFGYDVQIMDMILVIARGSLGNKHPLERYGWKWDFVFGRGWCEPRDLSFHIIQFKLHFYFLLLWVVTQEIRTTVDIFLSPP